jgi:hypothetical protein
MMYQGSKKKDVLRTLYIWRCASSPYLENRGFRVALCSVNSPLKALGKNIKHSSLMENF